MLEYKDLIKDNPPKIQDRLCVYYDPCSGGKLEIKCYKEIIDITSGTDHFPDTSFLNALDEENLRYYQTTLSDYTWVITEILTDEILNPESDGYIHNDNKQKIILHMKQINTNGTTISFPYVGSRYDALLIQASLPFKDIIDTVDQHVCANAYQENRKIILLLQKEQIDFINQNGEKAFKSEFIRKNKKYNQKQQINKKHENL